eukprot:8263409-Alexandrium_andersonii.AAC.1
MADGSREFCLPNPWAGGASPASAFGKIGSIMHSSTFPPSRRQRRSLNMLRCVFARLMLCAIPLVRRGDEWRC